ncbi:hypothetical protein DFH29DRAFT_877341 [Suillus ampliporus]|nr:hypothetical protein DFH29DRAFT_877341 [Suillus ampliporus]
MAPSQVTRAKKKAPAKANVVLPEHQCARSPRPFHHTAQQSDRNTDDSYQQHERDEPDGEHDDKQDEHQEPDHEQDEHDKQHSREDLQTGRDGNHDDDDPMELDRTPGKDTQLEADDEHLDPAVFNVLEQHQAKNGRRKAPSPTCLLSTRMHALARSLPVDTHTNVLTPNERDQPKHQAEGTNKQANPSKLGFYPSCWQAFLQAAKLEMHLQAVLTHPVPEHSDAVGLAQEVLDAVLWKYHSKDIRLEKEYCEQMSRLLCDDLFTFCTELKKVIISIAKQLYGIFPRSSVCGGLVQKYVTEAASKLIKSGDYLQLPDLSEGKYKNFVSQVLKDGCQDFYYGNGKKALKLMEEFQCSIPVNGLVLVAAVSPQAKGVLTGFRETGTDKVPDLSADKCRSDFNSLRKSVDTLIAIPDRRRELEEMLEEWAESGMMNGLCNDSDGGSGGEDVNIII